MPTRLKRPSILKQLALSGLMLTFIGYLGYSVVEGQFGIESNKRLKLDIEVLEAKSAALQVEIDSYKHRVDLFSPASLDPDILTEKARSLLNMAHADDIVVMTDPISGLPVSSSFQQLAEKQLSDIIGDGSIL